MSPLEALRENDWLVLNLWLVAAVFVLALLWRLVDWLTTGWMRHVLRNHLDARRRIARRDRREPRDQRE